MFQPKSMADTMTKADLVSAVAVETGLTKADVSRVVDTMPEVVLKEVKKNGECVVPGFGKMTKTKRKARKGRNPATGEEINIPAKNVPKLKLSKTVKDALS